MPKPNQPGQEERYPHPRHFSQIPGRLIDFMCESRIFVRLAQNTDEMTEWSRVGMPGLLRGGLRVLCRLDLLGQLPDLSGPHPQPREVRHCDCLPVTANLRLSERETGVENIDRGSRGWRLRG